MKDAVLFDYHQSEVAEALPYYVAARAIGAKPGHPAAEAMLDAGASLADIAAKFCPPDVRMDRSAPAGLVLQRGLGSSDFSGALAASVLGLASSTYDAANEVAPFVLPIPAKDFKPSRVPALSVGSLTAVSEGGTTPTVSVSANSALEAVSLGTNAARIKISRQVIEGDDIGMLASIGRRLGLAVSRAVADAVVAALEDTATTLSDGIAFWVSGSNFLASGGGAPSTATLGAAAKALRKLTDGAGNLIGAAPQVLVVPPSLEYSSLVLAASLPPGALTIAVLSNLTSDAKWFLFPSPAIAPALGLMQLTPVGQPPFTIERGNVRGGEDGAVIEVIADFRVTRIARTAYCNIGA